MKKLGKGAAVVIVYGAGFYGVGLRPGSPCDYIARDWFECNGINCQTLRPGDKLEVRIRVIKKGKK